jgi:hypothetical protein
MPNASNALPAAITLVDGGLVSKFTTDAGFLGLCSPGRWEKRMVSHPFRKMPRNGWGTVQVNDPKRMI